jgi:biopolymer transport protein ExbD
VPATVGPGLRYEQVFEESELPMAMSLGPAEDEEDVPMSDINVTPLVDVMLVLLIIFLIAVPVVLQTVPVELPKVRYEPTTTKPENVNLSVRRGRKL